MNAKYQEQPPFIRVREVTSGCPNAGYWTAMAPELKRKYFMAYWTEARLRRHLEMLKAFGFNSFQISIAGQTEVNAGVDPQAWRKRVVFMCKTAHELGLSVTQFVWGSCVTDGHRFRQDLDWHKPEDRARLEADYRNAVELAPYVDRVITQWVDPGNRQPGGIDAVVDMHNAIMTAFRAKNPKVRGALSAWFLDDFAGQRYPGYVDEGTLAANKALDRDSDVALGRFNYNCDGINGAGGNSGKTLADRESQVSGKTLDAIAASGRQAGIWGWYTADDEIRPALHVRTRVLQNYFRNLPPETRTKLTWHSLDDNCHGLNMQNLYVAGKLMQDPSLDAQKLLGEFVRGFVGASNAPAVAAALRAIEQARTRSECYKKQVLDARAPLSVEKEDLPATWLDETTTAVDAALRGLQTVKLAPDFKPAWPVTMEPADYLDELTPQLEAIRQMLAFLKGAREVERMKAAGEPVAKLEAAIRILPKVIYDPAHAAGLETDAYQQKLAALKKAVLGK